MLGIHVARRRSAVVCVLLVAAVATCGGPNGSSRLEPSERPPSASEVVHFDSLEEMVATSHVVIEGEVVETRAGRSIGVGHGALQFHEVVVRVVRPLAGNPGTTLVLEEDGLLATLSSVGDRGIYFLIYKRDQPGTDFLRVVNSQGRYRLDRSGVLHGSNPNDGLVRELQRESADVLAARIVRMAERVRAGELTPKPYSGGNVPPP